MVVVELMCDAATTVDGLADASHGTTALCAIFRAVSCRLIRETDMVSG